MTPQSLYRISVCHPKAQWPQVLWRPHVASVMQSDARQLGVALLPEEGTRKKTALPPS
jgi:hypothetical protein